MSPDHKELIIKPTKLAAPSYLRIFQVIFKTKSSGQLREERSKTHSRRVVKTHGSPTGRMDNNAYKLASQV